MGINLVKGQNINLSKEFKGQTKFKVGLRWDALKVYQEKNSI